MALVEGAGGAGNLRAHPRAATRSPADARRAHRPRPVPSARRAQNRRTRACGSRRPPAPGQPGGASPRPRTRAAIRNGCCRARACPRGWHRRRAAGWSGRGAASPRPARPRADRVSAPSARRAERPRRTALRRSLGRREPCGARGRAIVNAGRDGTLGRHLGDDLHHVERLDLVLELLRLDPVREHGHAERAGDGDHLGVGLEGLGGAQQVDALVRVLLDPHAPAARPAAHAELLMAAHLLHLGARPGEHRARLVVDLVEAAVVAGVVVDGLLLELGWYLEAALRDQLRHQLGGVDDLVATAELRELVLDGVEAMRAVDDDLLHARVIETLDARLRHGLVEVLVAEAARGLAVAGLLLAEAGKVDARLREQAGEGLGGLLVAVVEGAGAADVVKVLGVRLVGDGGYAEPLRPVEALLGAEAPRVRLRLHALEGARQLVREAGRLLHQVAAHVDDLVDVLDHHRARLLARPAHVARPQHLVRDDGPDDVLAHLGRLGAVAVGATADALLDHLVLVRVEVVAQVEQELARGQRLPGGGRRALRGAPAALGAAEHVEHLLPGELVDVRGAEGGGVLEVLLGERAERLELAEE